MSVTKFTVLEGEIREGEGKRRARREPRAPKGTASLAASGTHSMTPNDPKPQITFTRARAALASGKWSVAALVLAFLVTGLLVPAAAHLPRWVEVELVIGAWWVVWVCALAYLLHSTCGVSDDASAPHGPAWLRGGNGDWSSGCSDLGCLGDASLAGEGCGQAVLVIACLVFLVLGVWLLIEFVIPGLAFLMYVLVRGMLARAVSGRGDCQGNVARSVLWGTLWATVYTLPLALAVWGVHAAKVVGR